MWVSSVFVLGAFFPPHPALAALRGFLSMVLAPWLLKLRTEQSDAWKATQRERRKALNI